jgi:hypothetical protein
VHARISTFLRKFLRAQAGFTVIEQVVAAGLLAFVVGIALTALNSMMRAQPADQEWGHTVANGQAGIYQMTRELRQGLNVKLISGYRMSADVSSSCTRKSTTAPAAPPAEGAGGAPVITSLQNVSVGTPVFTSPSSRYFQVAVILRSAGTLTTAHTHNVYLTDGFFARNS